jgi:hypothetical protein
VVRDRKVVGGLQETFEADWRCAVAEAGPERLRDAA